MRAPVLALALALALFWLSLVLLSPLRDGLPSLKHFFNFLSVLRSAPLGIGRLPLHFLRKPIQFLFNVPIHSFLWRSFEIAASRYVCSEPTPSGRSRP